jgi:DNA-binding winged helix-turn-helix (wHTH) protein
MGIAGEKNKMSAGLTKFGAFEVDGGQRQLRREGAEIHLTPKAFDLLGVLIEHAPRVVSKAELHQAMWPKSFVSDATLVGLVKELRRALDDHDRAAPMIRTVQRVGYAFCRPLVTSAPSQLVWRWIVVDGRRVPLKKGENTIGRDPLSTVWIDFASVSRHHARIVISGSQALLEDVGSKNGTTVGAERVAEARELRDGDRLAFGTVDAVFFSSESGLPTVTQGPWSRAAEKS